MAEKKATAETFTIETEFVRDSVYAGIWNRLCCELRGNEVGHHLHEYIENHAVRRGDPATLFKYLDVDIACLTTAQAQPKPSVPQTSA